MYSLDGNSTGNRRSHSRSREHRSSIEINIIEQRMREEMEAKFNEKNRLLDLR